MVNVFIDCGYHVGKALEYYLPLMTDEWVLYAFEPKDDPVTQLALDKLPSNITPYLRKEAVWIKDGKVDFWISEYSNASFIDGLSKNAPAEKIKVPCIDFSKFVAGFPKDANIVCSMDIEGAEFKVLRKMVKTGTIKRIKLLDIEFHNRLMLDETPESAQALRQEIESTGTLVKLKIEV